ncbi:carbohydrate ABC transporter permease [Paenibacillus roseipurpureus]|uniref:Carbohydrate ABC transporter permease n=1 Tax=Paenibacillus roseopurpureus TaxID=2918901 RepID=A0AA96RL96_9BACL|nr:carbohydrate ABC transporter permease [Paenibacillus sp. MBLB1832]WNR42907.1 carbohydrate ABC transporter permease [Paenibacillus sp. MBLB1832]
MLIKPTTGERMFNICNISFMIFLILVMLYPLVNTIAVSFSSSIDVISGRVNLWPVNFQTDTYTYVMGDKRFINSFLQTIYFTAFITVIQTVMSMAFAYPLSKSFLKGRGLIMNVLVFLMLFGGGGFIPSYLLIKSLGLINSYWALWLPAAINIWHVIIFRNFFSQLPEGLEEAASIDGASPFRTFFQIVVPLSMPVIAALALFNAVGGWNTFFNSIIYLDEKKQLLQVYLREIIQVGTITSSTGQTIEREVDAIAPDQVKAATLMLTTLPILLVYPFVQKYFVKGMMVGSIK